MTRAVLVTLLVAVLAASLGGCSSGNSRAGSTDTTTLSGSLTVSAAASLQAAFTEIKSAFQSTHPEVKVTVNLGASSTLAQQIINGAPVDIFASADEPTMTTVSSAGFVAAEPVIFATNSLAIIVRKGNPLEILSLADLAQSGLIYVTCAPTVPIGNYAEQALQKARVSVSPKSFEPDVKGIVTKVTSGEADAGIVYATDITAAGENAENVAIPLDRNIIARYPIAMLTTAKNTAVATAWIAFLISPQGQSILRGFGFDSP